MFRIINYKYWGKYIFAYIAFICSLSHLLINRDHFFGSFWSYTIYYNIKLYFGIF